MLNRLSDIAKRHRHVFSRRALFALAVAVLLGPLSVKADERVSVLVFDASGSMWAQMEDGVTRIEIARDVVGDYFRNRAGQVPISVVAYGHNRRGDCEDIEVIVPMGVHDGAELESMLRALNPRGMTPLTAAMARGREQIPRTAESADIILVTDGLENCGGDPCALAAELAAEGLNIRAHVVGFALTEEEVNSLSCVTEHTGGQLFTTNSGEELAAALSDLSTQEGGGAVEVPEPSVEEEAVARPQALNFHAVNDFHPRRVPSPDWQIETTDGELIVDTRTTELELALEPGEYRIRARKYGEEGAMSLRVEAGMDAAHELRLPTPNLTATLTAPTRAEAGESIEIEWDGPDIQGDFLTIVEADSPDNARGNRIATRFGSPARLTAPDDTGEFEVRYVLGQTKRVLARVPITLTGVDARLEAPTEAEAGAQIEVVWEGPDARGDYLTIVEADSPDNARGNRIA
ncbi:MAG: vWA domain-containing protein, partial [Halothiobacillaceae bacterium]